jgi:glycosyltransferase involved in cell wall biosynthesis
MQAVNIFYQPMPKKDHWLPLDRYLNIIYRLLRRGRGRSGPAQAFWNLCQGLTQLGVPYRVNDFAYAGQHPEERACIIGGYNVLESRQWRNEIIYGPSIIKYPVEVPDLLERFPISKVVVYSDWQRQLYESAWGERLVVWPVGIDTDKWSPAPQSRKDIDLLIYEKVDTSTLFYDDPDAQAADGRLYEDTMIKPIRRYAEQHGLKTARVRYGFYREKKYLDLLRRSKAMVFLSRSETQGLAYLEALSSGVPVMAWDKGALWRERLSHTRLGPKRVRATSVPYWDERCGVKFKTLEQFTAQLAGFFEQVDAGQFNPRAYICEHLTLKQQAASYLQLCRDEQPATPHDNACS